MNEQEIIINQIAQNLISIEDGISWYDSLSDSDKKYVLSKTIFFIEQSHPNDELINKSINNIPLKPTMTPIVLLKTYSLNIAMGKILKLPEYEYRKSFISLITIFKNSDSHRRDNICKDRCEHYWHQDL
tara:strand:- start:19919 stop:20305 length:387 start_codon:yes stop_codon:yes gene_type:complete